MMNVQAKPDWIGTPRIQEDAAQRIVAIDFSLTGDDSRYRLTVRTDASGVHYDCKKYGVTPGSQKPFPIDIPVTNDMLPLFERILHDPYVQAFL